MAPDGPLSSMQANQGTETQFAVSTSDEIQICEPFSGLGLAEEWMA